MLVRQPSSRVLLNDVIQRHIGARPVKILEAGGGSRTVLEMNELDVRSITTVDISPEQLARNTYADVKIEGDLEAFRFEERYDLVIIYQVLEHLAGADRALDNLAEACGDGGLFVVGSPYPHSFSGIVTRLTPHWFHVFFYRFVLGQAHAGEPGYPPFPTYYHPLTEPERLRVFLDRQSFDCLYLVIYQSEVYRRARAGNPVVGILLMLVTALINLVTPKSYDARRGDYHAVFRRRAGAGDQDRA
jgi:SAM-dependent methyltransferase